MRILPAQILRPVATLVFTCIIVFVLMFSPAIVSATGSPLFDLDLALDGNDDYASTSDNPTLDLGIGAGEDFTIETFFYVVDLDNTTNDTLLWKQGSYGLYILFSDTQADRFIYRVYTSPTTYAYQFYETELSVGWHHVAAVFDNEYTVSEDLFALYVDGSLAVSSTAVEWTPGIPNSSNALYVGAYTGLNPLDGWMEETRLSNVVRYNGATYNVPDIPFTSDANTRALWHFNQAWGALSFADSSGNGNTLTGINGAQIGNPSGMPPVTPTKALPAPLGFGKISPVNHVLKQSINLTLKWKASKWATSYEYCLDTVNNNSCDTSWTPAVSTSASLSGLVNNTVYYWQVRSTNGTGVTEANSARWWSFQVKYAPPVLVAPALDEHVLVLRPAFMWTDPNLTAPLATSYTIQVATSSTFSTILYTGTAPAGATSHVSTKNLPAGKLLYWRMRANGADGPSAWVSRSFTTPTPPSVPVLLLPANNALDKNYTPTLKWKAVKVTASTTFDHYQVQVDDDRFFGSPIVDDVSLTLSSQIELTTPPLPHNTKFYWRVLAYNNLGQYSTSAVRTFRTVVDAPVLLTPADTTTTVTLKPTFEWEDATLPFTSYTIQISTSSSFKTLMVNATTMVSSYTRNTNFPAGKQLYWRIRVNGVNGPSAWSSVFSFTTP